MPPYQAGNNMAHDVDLDARQYSDGALKFGAGTPNVADAIGFAVAARFLIARVVTFAEGCVSHCLPVAS